MFNILGFPPPPSHSTQHAKNTQKGQKTEMQIKECTNPLLAQNARETSTRQNANEKQTCDKTDNSLMNQNNLQNNQFKSNIGGVDQLSQIRAASQLDPNGNKLLRGDGNTLEGREDRSGMEKKCNLWKYESEMEEEEENCSQSQEDRCMHFPKKSETQVGFFSHFYRKQMAVPA